MPNYLGRYRSSLLVCACVVACYLVTTAVAAKEVSAYYVSASAGNDNNDGRTEKTPWASLDRVVSQRLAPGDTVRFRAGDRFIGQLIIDESGAPDAVITFTSYGDGEKPILDAAPMEKGSAVATVVINDQDYIEIEGLEIQNFRRKSLRGVRDVDAFGILVRNTGKRFLKGFEFHNLTVQNIYPIKLKKHFDSTSVSGIRFETLPAKTYKDAVNTSEIYLHNNVLRHTGRFGMSLRHRPSKVDRLAGLPVNYDVNVRITGNTCEHLGGSCVLMNGVYNGLLEGNIFLRSGSTIQAERSVQRGSGAWFFRSRHIVAQKNVAISSRGHNDSSGIHVDYGNEDILVQYNFLYDNEGYGTEILGKNKNIIWRYNISVGDGTRRIKVPRPDGKTSHHAGKTVFVSDFSVPRRIQSRGVYIYNNTYVTAANSQPGIEINSVDTHIINNIFVASPNSHMGHRVKIGWNDVQIARNAFSGSIAPAFIARDSRPLLADISFVGEASAVGTYALPSRYHAELRGQSLTHPSFPAAGKGILGHISEVPEVDFFNKPLDHDSPLVGAGY